MNKDLLANAIKTSVTLADVCKKVNQPGSYGNIKRYIKMYNLDISHFTQKRTSKINRICPICKKPFKVYPSEKKKTCGYSCSNKFFRVGPNNGNWKPERYTTTCFFYHKKECIICKEKNIVEVHHYDGNHNNNDPGNLIPLCPTHHQYFHSRFKYLIENQIKKYITEYSSV